MILYGYFHCPCIYESAFGLQSLHKTYDGAVAAMDKSRQKTIEEWEEIYSGVGEVYKVHDWEKWEVREVEVFE